MAFASLTIDLNARIANIERDMGRAAHIAETQSRRMEAGFAKAASAAAALAGALGVGSFAAFVKSGIDAADSMRDMAIAAGTSTQALASYKLAAEQNGTSIEDLAAGLGKLSVFMGKNAEEAKKLGLTAADPVEAFAQLADVLQRIESPAQRNAVAAQVLGKSYKELMPLLADGGDELRKSAEASSDYARRMAALAVEADKFNDSISALKQTVGELGVVVGTALVGPLNDWLDATRRLIEENGRLVGISGGLAAALIPGLDAKDLTNTARALREVNEARAELTDALHYKASKIGELFPEYSARKVEEAKARLKQAAIVHEQFAAIDAKRTAADARGRAAAKPFDAGRFFGGGSANGERLDDLSNTPVALIAKQRAAVEAAARRDAIAAQQAEIDQAIELEDYRIASDERAAAALGRLREAHLGIIDPVQQYRDKLDEVQSLMDAGLFTPEQAAEAGLYWQEQIDAAAGFGKKVEEQVSEMDEFIKNSARGFQTSLADFLFDPFADGIEGMLAGFGNMLKRMAAEAIAADITRAIFGQGGSSGGGGGQNWLGAFAELFGFAQGGAFTVGGGGGTDSQLVAFRATPGERVEVRTPAQQRSSGGGVTINMNVVAQDATSFRQSMGQIQSELAFAMAGARRFT